MSTVAAGPMRMGAGGGRKKIKDKATFALAWAAFLLGFAASPLLATTPVGSLVDFVLGVADSVVGSLLGLFGAGGLDGALPLILLVGMAVATAIDIFKDGVPNMVALYCTMLLCSVGRSVSGDFGGRIETWANALLDNIRGPLTAELGTGSAIALAGSAVLASYLVARRTMAAKSSGR